LELAWAQELVPVWEQELVLVWAQELEQGLELVQG
jgi:hypothetical protein